MQVLAYLGELMKQVVLSALAVTVLAGCATQIEPVPSNMYRLSVIAG